MAGLQNQKRRAHKHPFPHPSVAANKPVFAKFAVYSLALAVSSLGGFFLVQRGPLGDALGLSPTGRDVVGAAVGVVAANGVIGLYAWSAWAEEATAAEVEGSPAPVEAAGGGRKGRRKAE